MSSFVDSSTECAICLLPLAKEDCKQDEVTDDDTTATLTLHPCGHRWHVHCIREQVRHSKPIPGQRILWRGCRCAKCGQATFPEDKNGSLWCNNKNLAVTTDIKMKVDALLKEHCLVENQHSEEELEAARQKYAFYLCVDCSEPYFGGTVACTDDDEDATEPRRCPDCSHSTTCCRHPIRHQGAHVWKCRYCCRPATRICYGTVHFCNTCHERNSAAVVRQRGGVGRPVLDAIPCPGSETCCYPMNTSTAASQQEPYTRHQNGADPSCEQVYYCALCVLGPVSASTVPSGTPNLITNPSGQSGLQGWTQRGRHYAAGWQVEELSGDVPLVGEDIDATSTTTNFVSSFVWGVMSYTVPLHRHLHTTATTTTVVQPVEVAAYFLGRTDCPSVFRLGAIVHDSHGQKQQEVFTGVKSAPADAWERVSLILNVSAAHSVTVVICGKDERFWQGTFGAKAAGCSIRILCPEDQVAHVLAG